MTGTQEYISDQSFVTTKRDLFCSNCGKLLRMSAEKHKRIKIFCPNCGVKNDFLKEKIRPFDAWGHNNKKYPIRYWARKYGIPENSCYMAFRRRGIGHRKQGIGEAKLVTQREFLSGAIYTKIGREIISDLISRECILTDREIISSI